MQQAPKQIYVHHVPLAEVLQHLPSRLTVDKKCLIHAYRQAHLTRFCLDNGLPSPSIQTDVRGKPFVVNIPKLALSHSHGSYDYVLAYSLDVSNIGVDVEHVSRILPYDALAQRYFHPEEYHLWQKSGCDAMLWLKVWTIKEAVLKAHGLGIRLPLQSLNARLQQSGMISVGDINHERLGSFYFYCKNMHGSMITLACPSADRGFVWVEKH